MSEQSAAILHKVRLLHRKLESGNIDAPSFAMTLIAERIEPEPTTGDPVRRPLLDYHDTLPDDLHREDVLILMNTIQRLRKKEVTQDEAKQTIGEVIERWPREGGTRVGSAGNGGAERFIQLEQPYLAAWDYFVAVHLLFDWGTDDTSDATQKITGCLRKIGELAKALDDFDGGSTLTDALKSLPEVWRQKRQRGGTPHGEAYAHALRDAASGSLTDAGGRAVTEKTIIWAKEWPYNDLRWLRKHALAPLNNDSTNYAPQLKSAVNVRAAPTAASDDDTHDQNELSRPSIARIAPTPPEDRENVEQYNSEMARLAGLDHWPPQSHSTWVTVLNRAGFTQQRIEQFLAMRGADGFKEAEVGELPGAMVSASVASGEAPLFSVMLREGLERWRRDTDSSTASRGDNKSSRSPTSPGADGWSREMSKTEAGRLLGCLGDDRTCRDHLKALLDGDDTVIKTRTGQKHRFCLAWVRSIEPTAVAKFRAD